MRKTPILLRVTGLTGRVVAITRYTQHGEQITAHEKYDVTEDFEECCAQYLAELAETRPEIEPGEGRLYLLDGLDVLIQRLKERHE